MMLTRIIFPAGLLDLTAAKIMPKDNPNVEEVKGTVAPPSNEFFEATISKSTKFDLEARFRLLTDQWRRETRYMSSLSKMCMHPAYQKIIGMGEPAIALILHELQRSGGHWLWALHAITDEDPAPANASFDEAVDAWLNWGRRNHYIE